MINKKDKEKKFGPMVLNTKDLMYKEKNKEMVNSSGLTDLNTMENSKIIISTVKESIHGLMEEPIMENGNLIKWTEVELSYGLMAENT